MRSVGRMRDSYIFEQNIRRFSDLLELTSDPVSASTLRDLLARERRKLVDHVEALSPTGRRQGGGR